MQVVLLLVGARVLYQTLRVSDGDLRSVLRELLGEGERGGEDLRAEPGEEVRGFVACGGGQRGGGERVGVCLPFDLRSFCAAEPIRSARASRSDVSVWSSPGPTAWPSWGTYDDCLERDPNTRSRHSPLAVA